MVPDNALVNVLRLIARHIDEAVHNAIADCLDMTLSSRSEENERNRAVSPPIAAYMAGERGWVIMGGVRTFFVGKSGDWIEAVRFLVAEADRRGLSWEIPEQHQLPGSLNDGLRASFEETTPARDRIQDPPLGVPPAEVIDGDIEYQDVMDIHSALLSARKNFHILSEEEQIFINEYFQNLSNFEIQVGECTTKIASIRDDQRFLYGKDIESQCYEIDDASAEYLGLEDNIGGHCTIHEFCNLYYVVLSQYGEGQEVQGPFVDLKEAKFAMRMNIM
jgi:hypothetical protein